VLVARVYCAVRCGILLQLFGKTAAFGHTTLPAADSGLVGVPAQTLLPGRFSVGLYVGRRPEDQRDHETSLIESDVPKGRPRIHSTVSTTLAFQTAGRVLLRRRSSRQRLAAA
jgi:hypothetical protein